MSDRIYNFSAGPAVLPEIVLRNAQQALWNFDGSGIGILEHSHRGPEFTKVIQKAEALVRELASISDEYAVLFLQGGASLQFGMVPMNLLPEGGTADYLMTGAWSQKALKEAKLFGKTHIACSSEADNFTYIPGPAQTTYSTSPAYVHFTSNNTIFGTEWAVEPTPPAGAPLVCDASSDIFSRPIDVSKYGLIYAGAQKNLGPAGVVLVIIRKDLVERGPKNLSTMLQYRTYAGDMSMYNTPPTFAIYVLAEVLEWIKQCGGLAGVGERNRVKAGLLYDHLDASKMFRGTARKDSRSLMNVCFRATSEELENKFIKEAKKRGFDGLKGHRSVGGMRASIYNAFPPEGVTKLVEMMKEFERDNG